MWLIEFALGATPERLEARAPHVALLAEQHDRGLVRMAGPTPDDSRAFVVLDVPDRADVDAFLAEDPYYRTPGVTVVRVVAWAPFLT